MWQKMSINLNGESLEAPAYHPREVVGKTLQTGSNAIKRVIRHNNSSSNFVLFILFSYYLFNRFYYTMGQDFIAVLGGLTLECHGNIIGVEFVGE
jgi:hypothetical protein